MAPRGGVDGRFDRHSIGRYRRYDGPQDRADRAHGAVSADLAPGATDHPAVNAEKPPLRGARQVRSPGAGGVGV